MELEPDINKGLDNHKGRDMGKGRHQQLVLMNKAEHLTRTQSLNCGRRRLRGAIGHVLKEMFFS